MELTNHEIINISKEYDIQFIRLQFIDILGVARNVAIPVSQLEKALHKGIVFDGSSIKGFESNDKPDMFLIPDNKTFVVLPWRPSKGRVARLICDVYTAKKEPYVGCPRLALKTILKEANKIGYTMNASVEIEFFLFLTDSKGNLTTDTHDKAGYFDMSPIDLGEDARREMVLALERIGFEVESAHHEVAEGQHEIRFRYSDALDMADKIITFRTVIKIIAKRYGLHATFMPKPLAGVNGSGMHMHQSLFKKNKNIFWDPRTPLGLSDEAMFYIGGLLKHAKAITAVTNTTVNSYKRLVSGFEAPVYIAWATKNRSAMIRIPEKKELSTRIELRSPDATSNPYLALAVMLKAGLEGIINKIQTPVPIMNNTFGLSQQQKKELGIESLPLNLYEAICCLERDSIVKDALGPYIAERFITLKKQEWNHYQIAVHQWERDHYMII